MFMQSRYSLVVFLSLAAALTVAGYGFSLDGDPQLAKTDFDWPGFLGPKRDSRSLETGILKDWSRGKLQTVWKADIGKGYVLGSVAGGKFFQFDAVAATCRLICRDAKTGEIQWRFEYPFRYKDMYQFDEGPRATPLIDGQYVYIYGVEGMLHCLNTSDGAVVWKKNVSKEFGVVQNFFGVGSTPIIYQKYLVVMVGGSPDEDQNPRGGRLDAVRPNGAAVVVMDKSTGKVLYNLGDDLASYASIQLYREKDSLYGVAWLRTNVMGFDIANGKELWSYRYRARKYESVNASTPVVQGTQIFLSESYGLGSILLDVADNEPEVLWNDTNPRKQALATHWNTPVFHDGHLFACHGANRGGAEIRCVDWKTGEVRWSQRGYGRSSLTFVDGHFVVQDEGGELLLIEADSKEFRLVTKYRDSKDEPLPLAYPCWAAPVVSNGLLYVRGKNSIVCLKLIE